ncbi:MAG: 3-deoxy-manno-octulosonate cytidylyltransferase [Gammaproteobacteria bacterium]
MDSSFQVIIPARYASTRLPGKALLDIGGKPLIQHVYDSASASNAGQVLIATDDKRIESAARAFNAEVELTSSGHTSGTDRITEVVTRLGEADETIVVNVQGDEYGLPAAIINQVADILRTNTQKSISTLCVKIDDPAELNDPNVVKVIFDRDNTAIYFSRSPIPWHEQDSVELPCQPFRHIGIYAYRAGFLKTYSRLPPCPLEASEKLEQLRAIYHGYKIHVEQACEDCGIGIDTQEDLDLARRTADKLTASVGNSALG